MESIFVFPSTEAGYPVRIFTVEEELEFAGHPVLGAAAVIHKCFYSSQKTADINLMLDKRRIHLQSQFFSDHYNVIMNQGTPEFLSVVSPKYYTDIASSLNVDSSALNDDYPVEVVSTGLPYLLVPLKENLDKAKISISNFGEFISQFRAKFVYVFNPETLQCRTWNNSGTIEDIATGSAAGPLCAYLVKNGFKKSNELISISQGQYLNRPSIIEGWVSNINMKQEVFIKGDVSFFGSGEINI
ncbi:MAG: PhzF family phenazine biosynthesis isomerase [Syntrophomonadaceae bacterium]|nr:PhzF family phenazine biosynthesis isomerase [Syntrophomonadaceae bacterium]MDD3024699.1 PhzF family phenazine biosynthesis isomerase [Syntrophomonadaceae bacterium]